MRTRALGALGGAALGLLLLAPPAPALQAGQNRQAKKAKKLDAGYVTKADAIRQEVLEKYAFLARWCETERLLLQARYLCNEILLRDPNHEIRSLSDQLKAIPAREFKSRNRSTKKVLRDYANKRAFIDVPTAKKYVKLARWCKAEKLTAEEEDAYVRAYGYQTNNGTVNKHLKHAGYAPVFNYGLISGAEQKKFGKVLRRVEGTFLTDRNKQYKRQRKFWPDAWGFQTRHFMLMSNAHHNIVFPFAQECENLWEGIRVYGGKELTFRDNYKSEKLVVWLFGDETSYEVVLQTLGIPKNPSPGAAGFFGAYQRSYFFWADRFYARGEFADGLRSLAQTFYHEGTHQMMALQLRVKNTGKASRTYNSFWCVEAIANYMSTLEVKVDAKGAKEFVFGFPHPYQGWRADNSHMKGARYTANGHGKFRFTPLKAFTTNGQGGYMAKGAYHYNPAMALAHYLNHADGGKYQAAWFEYVRQQYTLRGSGQYIWELIDQTEEELTKNYIAWAKDFKSVRPKLPPGGRPGRPPGGRPGGQPGQPGPGQPPGGR